MTRTQSNWFPGSSLGGGMLVWMTAGILGGAMAGWLVGLAYGGLEALLIQSSSRILAVGAYFSLCGALTGGVLFGFLRGADPEGLAAFASRRQCGSEASLPVKSKQDRSMQATANRLAWLPRCLVKSPDPSAN